MPFTMKNRAGCRESVNVSESATKISSRMAGVLRPWDVGRGTWDVGRGTWDVGKM